MLYGQVPWTARTEKELIFRIETVPVNFPQNIPVSQLSKDFILKCLQKNENNRMNENEIVNHELIAGGILK